MPLALFVEKETAGEYEFQPELARSDVGAALHYGIRVGLGDDRPEVFRNAKGFSDQVITHFKTNEYYKDTNRFGEGRIKSLIGDLERSVRISFVQVMTDPSVPIPTRMSIWNKVDEHAPGLKLDAYAEFVDTLRRELTRQLERSPQRGRFTVDQAFPPPPGWELRREQIRQQRLREMQEQQQQQQGGLAPLPPG
jgi:hypothetical protein